MFHIRWPNILPLLPPEYYDWLDEWRQVITLAIVGTSIWRVRSAYNKLRMKGQLWLLNFLHDHFSSSFGNTDLFCRQWRLTNMIYRTSRTLVAMSTLRSVQTNALIFSSLPQSSSQLCTQFSGHSSMAKIMLPPIIRSSTAEMWHRSLSLSLTKLIADSLHWVSAKVAALHKQLDNQWYQSTLGVAVGVLIASHPWNFRRQFAHSQFSPRDWNSIPGRLKGNSKGWWNRLHEWHAAEN